MCLTCGCMDAHQEMGEHNFTYEDLKAAADENAKSVAETLEIMTRTAAKDKEDHAGIRARLLNPQRETRRHRFVPRASLPRTAPRSAGVPLRRA
jgi:hypothetical protein